MFRDKALEYYYNYCCCHVYGVVIEDVAAAAVDPN